MIKIKEDIHYYMECDKKALGIDCDSTKMMLCISSDVYIEDNENELMFKYRT